MINYKIVKVWGSISPLRYFSASVKLNIKQDRELHIMSNNLTELKNSQQLTIDQKLHLQYSKLLSKTMDNVLTSLNTLIAEVETDNPDYIKKLKTKYPELFE